MPSPKHFDEEDLEETSASSAPSLQATIVGIDAPRQAERVAEFDRLFDAAKGSRRIGRYVILRELGRGAMGVVFAAYHEELDRKVALKVLARGRQDRRDLELRLRREARALAKLSHPNVVQVYDVGEHRGRVFVAMEFIEGETMRTWMDREREHDLDELVALFIAVGRGLAAAHEAGVIHRDFKPENVILGRDGRPRVLDFGLARGVVHELDETEDPTFGRMDSLAGSVDDDDSMLLTQTGAQMGTPAYMSPEQHLGLPVGQGADQFGFCVALYEATHGQRPFAGKSILALALATQAGEIQPPPAGFELPEWLRGIILRGLSPSPGDRFPSMTALVEALNRGPPERQRRRWLQSAMFGLVALVAGSLAVASEPPPSPCPGPAEVLASRWPDTAETLRTQLDAAQVAYATTTAHEVERRFRRWATGWSEQDHQACAATAIRHEFSAAVLDRRRACLERLADEADLLAARLARADPLALEHGVEAIAALPDPSTCLAVERLLDANDNVHASASHETLTALRVRALVDPADPSWGPPSRALVAAAIEADDPWLEAKARQLLAHNLRASGELDRARTQLLDALDAAETSDRDPLIVELAIELTALELDAGDRTRLELLARRLAAAREVESRPSSRAHATRVLAQANLALDELDRAEQLSREALEAYEALETKPPDISEVHVLLGTVAERRGRRDEARHHRAKALDEARISFGAEHPRVQALERALSPQ